MEYKWGAGATIRTLGAKGDLACSVLLGVVFPCVAGVLRAYGKGHGSPCLSKGQ